METTTIELPESEPEINDNKSVESEINEVKNEINQNNQELKNNNSLIIDNNSDNRKTKRDKSVKSEIKPIKARKIRNDKGLKRGRYNKSVIKENKDKIIDLPHKRNMPIWIIAVVVLGLVAIIFFKGKIRNPFKSPQPQMRSIFQ